MNFRAKRALINSIVAENKAAAVPLAQKATTMVRAARSGGITKARRWRDLPGYRRACQKVINDYYASISYRLHRARIWWAGNSIPSK